MAFLDAVNRAKSARGATVGRHVKRLRGRPAPRTLALLDRGRDDVLAAARVSGHTFEAEARPSKRWCFEVAEAELVEPPAAPVPKA